MSEFNVVRRCANCGVILQSENPEEKGYIDKIYLDEAKASTLLFCRDCFEHTYQVSPKQSEVSEDYLTMIKDAKAGDAMIIWVIDLFSFECALSKKVVDLIKGLPILIVANKRDLMPRGLKDADLTKYVRERFLQAGLPVTLDDIVLVTLQSTADVSDIRKIIEKKRQVRDVYIIGAKESGKSFLLSALLRNYVNKTNRAVVTKEYHGTKLMSMQIPLDNSTTMYDAPGSGIENFVVGQAPASVKEKIIPIGAMKERKNILLEGDSLFIGGLARIDLISSKKPTEFTLVSASQLECHKERKSSRLEHKFMDYLSKCHEKGLTYISSPMDMDVFEVSIEEKKMKDLGIAGLCYLSFKGNGQTIRIYIPKGIGLYIADARKKK